jgi:hypothetical protein
MNASCQQNKELLVVTHLVFFSNIKRLITQNMKYLKKKFLLIFRYIASHKA